MKEKMPIEEFCDRYRACEAGRLWSKRNCVSMRDAWYKLPDSWFLWVATRPGVLSDAILERAEVKFAALWQPLRFGRTHSRTRQAQVVRWLRRNARPDFTRATHTRITAAAYTQDNKDRIVRTARQTGKSVAAMVAFRAFVWACQPGALSASRIRGMSATNIVIDEAHGRPVPSSDIDEAKFSSRREYVAAALRREYATLRDAIAERQLYRERQERREQDV